MRKLDESTYIGKKFNKWTVFENVTTTGRHPKVLARCDCGRTSVVNRENVISGRTKGCRLCSGRKGSANPRWSGYGEIPANFFYIAKKGAFVREIDFNLTIEDVDRIWKEQRGICALTGIKLVMASRKNGLTASLDRKNSSGAYSADNVQFVHKHVNLMKNHLDQDYFLEMCRAIVEHCAAG